MKFYLNKSQVAIAVATALSAASMGAASANGFGPSHRDEGTYVTGDFHNHTTCSDGSISMQKLVKKSMDKKDTPWGLDWFVQAGHGGNGNRNCTLAEDASLATPAYPLVYAQDGTLQGPQTTWQNTNPPVEPKGDVNGAPPSQRMWRWQSIQEYQYPLVEYLSAYQNKPMFMGLVVRDAALQRLAARQMAAKSAAFNDAPPTSPPSTSGCANSAAALSALTLPP